MSSPYGGGGTPTDLGRVPAIAPRIAHGLRTASNPDGWHPSSGERYRPARVAPVRVRQTKPKPVKGLDPATNLVGPKDDDTPIRRYESTTTTVQDMVGIVPTIRMGEWV